jgi:Xaa-Pro aminopeptidase
MTEQNLDALVVSNIENVAYLAGSCSFDHSWAMSFWHPIAYPSIVIITRTHGSLLVAHDVFIGVLQQSGAIENVRSYYEKGRDEVQDYVGLTVQAIKDLGVSKGRLGIELGSGYTTDPKIGMPLKNFLAIQKSLPEAKFIDGSDILRTLRMIKSEHEIEYIRKATEAVDKTFQICFETIKPGMSESEVASVSNRIISEQGARPAWTLAISSPLGIYSPRPNVKLDKGKLLFLDLGATYAGYHTDFNRMAIVGEATENQSKTCANIAKITRATVESVKPGIRACDLVDICKSQYPIMGVNPPPGPSGYGPHRKIGHGIGLTLSEAPQITTYEKTTLQPGMVFCIEPPITTTEGFYVTEQVVAVTDDRYEVLSKANDQLYEIK